MKGEHEIDMSENVNLMEIRNVSERARERESERVKTNTKRRLSEMQI